MRGSWSGGRAPHADPGIFAGKAPQGAERLELKRLKGLDDPAVELCCSFVDFSSYCSKRLQSCKLFEYLKY